MSIPKDTLKAMIRDYGGFAVSDEELEIMRPEMENYLAEVEKLKSLNLSGVLSARLLRAEEGGQLQ
jgi:hypothetical protein